MLRRRCWRLNLHVLYLLALRSVHYSLHILDLLASCVDCLPGVDLLSTNIDHLPSIDRLAVVNLLSGLYLMSSLDSLLLSYCLWRLVLALCR